MIGLRHLEHLLGLGRFWGGLALEGEPPAYYGLPLGDHRSDSHHAPPEQPPFEGRGFRLLLLRGEGRDPGAVDPPLAKVAGAGGGRRRVFQHGHTRSPDRCETRTDMAKHHYQLPSTTVSTNHSARKHSERPERTTSHEGVRNVYEFSWRGGSSTGQEAVASWPFSRMRQTAPSGPVMRSKAINT